MGSAALMRTVFSQGLTLGQAQTIGVCSGALQAYREIAVRALQYYETHPSAVGTAIQTERIITITKMLGF